MKEHVYKNDDRSGNDSEYQALIVILIMASYGYLPVHTYKIQIFGVTLNNTVKALFKRNEPAAHFF